MLPGQREDEEIAERLLAALETRAVEAGVQKLAAVVPQGGALARQLLRREYRASDNLRYFERELPAVAVPVALSSNSAAR